MSRHNQLTDAEPDAYADTVAHSGPHGEPDAETDAHADNVAHSGPHGKPNAGPDAHADASPYAKPVQREQRWLLAGLRWHMPQ